MTNLQAVLCPQCKGEQFITIPDHTKARVINKYTLFFRRVVYDNKTVTCGYCDGKGFGAIDVDSLVVFGGLKQ